MVPPVFAGPPLADPVMASTIPAIETPCTKVCVVHPVQRLCIGCGRSLDEIARWSEFDAGERRRIMALLPLRLKIMSATPAAVKA